MKNKKVPLRTCVVTKEKLEKKDLIRIVRTPEGTVINDKTYRANGRGAYLKKDSSVIEKAKQTKVLDRHLETTIDESIYEEILNELSK